MQASRSTHPRNLTAARLRRLAPLLVPLIALLFFLLSSRAAALATAPLVPEPNEPSTLGPNPFAVVSAGTYEDNNANVIFSTGWTRVANAYASGGTLTRSKTYFATARLYVTGAGTFQIMTARGPNRGIAQVLVDGNVVDRWDLYSSTVQYRVLSPVYTLPNAKTHWIGIRVTGNKNAASTGTSVVLDRFTVKRAATPTPTNTAASLQTTTPGSSATFTPTATGTAQPTQTPTASGTSLPTNTPSPTPPATSSRLRRVNMPYFAQSPVVTSQAAVFWLGKVTENTQYGDLRIGYNDSEIFINANVIDAYLWYNANSPDPGNLTQYDSVSIYLSENGTSSGQPDSGSYRFDAEFTWWESNRSRWQAAYQGNGSSWALSSPQFTTLSGWRGNQPNDNVLDQGFNITYHIPYAALGLAGPPAQGTRWGLAVALHNRNDAAGTLIADRVWPENLSTANPTTWGQLQFGLASDYTPPSATNLATVTIKHNLNGQVAPTTNVGGYTLCGTNIGATGLAYFQKWGIQNWAGEEYLNVMNQTDVVDWPCYNKVYGQFPLTAIPAGKVITSARLTLYQYGHAGDSGQNPGPSLVQVYGADTGWDPNTINWNNAPRPTQNLDRQWAGTGNCPSYINCPSVTWDVSGAVADAYKAGDPFRYILYDADEQISSGKYFFASEQGDWNATNRPVLVVTYGDP